MLASFVGAAPFDFGMLFISLPTAGIAVIAAVIARTAGTDLLLTRPVLVIDETGILDRRVAPRRIAWSEVTAATSLLSGRGGVVLELAQPLPGDLDPFRPGTFLYERTEPGVLHIPVRGMTEPAHRLAAAILEHAERHGATVAERATHERARRRSIM